VEKHRSTRRPPTSAPTAYRDRSLEGVRNSNAENFPHIHRASRVRVKSQGRGLQLLLALEQAPSLQVPFPM
ncbi:hypothetical protein F442_16703, partial [Phytophthora nicotianae P10297]